MQKANWKNRISRNILIEESKFKNAVFGISQEAGVRVISRDKTGYAYTGEVTEEKLMSAAEVASHVARGTQAGGPIDVKEVKRESFITVRLPLEDIVDTKRL